MTLAEIKAAVDAGKTVHWINEGYEVISDGWRYLIVWVANNNYMGLTHGDGVTLNGKPEEFFIA